jgi:competence protein ComEC
LDWLGRIWDQVVVVGSLLAMKFQTVWFVPRWAFALGIVIALLMVFLRVRRLVLLLVCFMAVGVSLIFPAGTSQRVVQLDVGQGDSALVSEGARHGLIDSGAQGALTPDAWLRLFAFYGVRKLDWLALTHMDADHAGGVAMLLALLPIGCLELPVSLGDESLGLERELRTMAVRYRVRVVGNGDGCFPYATRMFHGNERSNADMAVFSIPFVDGAVYLNMGDAGGETELAAVSWFKRKYPAAKLLWKLSHHGARASSSDEVIRTLFPVGVTGEAWVSVGAGNRYGHPSFEVLKRVDRLNIQLRRTDREGALVYSGLCCVNR